MDSEQKAGTFCISWNENSTLALGSGVMVALCGSFVFSFASISKDLPLRVLVGMGKNKTGTFGLPYLGLSYHSTSGVQVRKRYPEHLASFTWLLQHGDQEKE